MIASSNIETLKQSMSANENFMLTGGLDRPLSSSFIKLCSLVPSPANAECETNYISDSLTNIISKSESDVKPSDDSYSSMIEYYNKRLNYGSCYNPLFDLSYYYYLICCNDNMAKYYSFPFIEAQLYTENMKYDKEIKFEKKKIYYNKNIRSKQMRPINQTKLRQIRPITQPKSRKLGKY